MNYRVRKKLMAILVMGVFFTVRGHFWIAGAHEALGNEAYSEEQLFTFYISDGYFGSLEQLLVGTIVLILIIEYLHPKDAGIRIIRYHDRNKYLGARLKTVAFGAVGMTLCKFMVGLIFLIYNFGSELVFSVDTGEFVISGILIFSIYSIRCGIIYMCIRDLLNKKAIAIGLTVIIYYVLFYIWLDNLLYPIITMRWMPFLDLSTGLELYCGQMLGLELLLTVFRQIGLTLICLLIWSRIWKYKDVINIEK